ncbi:MAG TPA: hypothetical protein VHC00_17580 [Rhizobiaceae bacterium]|nr:hypothetical protein [Rhizobiaceae bacterium]
MLNSGLQHDAAEYIREMLLPLLAVSKGANLQFINYFLAMAWMETEEVLADRRAAMVQKIDESQLPPSGSYLQTKEYFAEE